VPEPKAKKKYLSSTSETKVWARKSPRMMTTRTLGTLDLEKSKEKEQVAHTKSKNQYFSL
jgi:hypothetical protein